MKNFLFPFETSKSFNITNSIQTNDIIDQKILFQKIICY